MDFFCSNSVLIDGIVDEEEVVIHTTLNEMHQDVIYPRLRSSVDPYAHVLYGNLDAERSAVKEVKCIASANKLVELIGTCCRQPGCTMNLQSLDVHVICGYTIKIEWLCGSKHRGFWYSSPIYASGFAVNYIIESALLLSGMNHYQFLRFCKFINLAHNSPSTYLRNQRLYAAPAIHQEYLLMRDGIVYQRILAPSTCPLCALPFQGSPQQLLSIIVI